MTAPPIVTANKKSLLVMVQDACGELGIKQPSSIVGNTDSQVIQLLALANREGKEFHARSKRLGGWQELRKEYTFTLAGVGPYTGNITSGLFTVTGLSSTTGIVAGYTAFGSGIAAGALVVSVDSSTQVTLDTANTATTSGVSITFGQESYSLPTDIDWFMTRTWWDRSMRWQLMGPLTAQEWQVLKSGISPVGPRRRFRIMGNKIYINPIPSAAATMAVEYFSNAWCQSSAAAAQIKWLADTDYYTLDDDAFTLGLKWRFKAAKGLDYEQEKEDYDMICERLEARNGTNRDLPLNAQALQQRFINNDNIPDTGFGT